MVTSIVLQAVPKLCCIGPCASVVVHTYLAGIAFFPRCASSRASHWELPSFIPLGTSPIGAPPARVVDPWMPRQHRTLALGGRRWLAKHCACLIRCRRVVVRPRLASPSPQSSSSSSCSSLWISPLGPSLWDSPLRPSLRGRLLWVLLVGPGRRPDVVTAMTLLSMTLLSISMASTLT